MASSLDELHAGLLGYKKSPYINFGAKFEEKQRIVSLLSKIKNKDNFITLCKIFKAPLRDGRSSIHAFFNQKSDAWWQVREIAKEKFKIGKWHQWELDNMIENHKTNGVNEIEKPTFSIS